MTEGHVTSLTGVMGANNLVELCLPARRFLNSAAHYSRLNLAQFAFRLQPILTVMARHAATFRVELIGAVLDLFSIKITCVE